MARIKKSQEKPNQRNHQLASAWSYGLLLLVLIFFGAIRARLSTVPLERDEGEYAYAGQLILHGIAPYKFCYTMKLPGTAAAYALLMAIFGQTPRGIHLGLLLASSVTTILIFFLAKRFFGSLPGIVAAAAFAFLSISPSVLGFAAHATQFVVFFAVGGILLLLKSMESQRLIHLFCCGILLGLAFLMKQPGILFFFFAVFYLCWRYWNSPRDWRRLSLQLGTVSCGAALPLLLTCLMALRSGVFGKFWFWTFTYAHEYGTAVSLSDGVQLLWSAVAAIVGSNVFLWLIAAAGLIAMFWDPKTREHLLFLSVFFIFSFAATCPGLYFRNHYFVLLLPAVSLLCAASVAAATNLLESVSSAPKPYLLPTGLFVCALAFSIFSERNFFFEMDPVAVSRTFYSVNPFVEALEVSNFIKSHSTAQDRIAVIGSEPEIYFYSDRLSATGYVYTYPLMEPQPFASTMQKEMIAEIEAAHPRFLIMVDNPLSWLRREKSDATIFEWFQNYMQGYHLVGIADMMKSGTEYHWADAATYRPRSKFRIFIYDRSDATTAAH